MHQSNAQGSMVLLLTVVFSLLVLPEVKLGWVTGTKTESGCPR